MNLRIHNKKKNIESEIDELHEHLLNKSADEQKIASFVGSSLPPINQKNLDRDYLKYILFGKKRLESILDRSISYDELSMYFYLMCDICKKNNHKGIYELFHFNTMWKLNEVEGYTDEYTQKKMKELYELVLSDKKQLEKILGIA